MIRTAITEAAFEAIAATLPLGSVRFENAFNERGERYVWLPPNVVNHLRAMRGPGESYSDVIVRLVAAFRRDGGLRNTPPGAWAAWLVFRPAMFRIAISAKAFEATPKTLPLGSVA